MCGCNNGVNSNLPVLWKVKMPDGTVKPYSSDIAARAKAAATPGAVLVPPAGASV